jgi:hypothetical protein
MEITHFDHDEFHWHEYASILMVSSGNQGMNNKPDGICVETEFRASVNATFDPCLSGLYPLKVGEIMKRSKHGLSAVPDPQSAEKRPWSLGLT